MTPNIELVVKPEYVARPKVRRDDEESPFAAHDVEGMVADYLDGATTRGEVTDAIEASLREVTEETALTDIVVETRAIDDGIDRGVIHKKRVIPLGTDRCEVRAADVADDDRAEMLEEASEDVVTETTDVIGDALGAVDETDLVGGEA